MIATNELDAALTLRDLSDPGQGAHAMQIILTQIVDALTRSWQGTVDVQRRRPVVAVEDNYDRLGYAPADIVRGARYSRYITETVMLRSHTTAGIPPVLRRLASSQPDERGSDVLLALPGLCYRRDSIDRLHVGTPHQVDLWRITRARMADTDLMRMAGSSSTRCCRGRGGERFRRTTRTPGTACSWTWRRRAAGSSWANADWPLPTSWPRPV